MENQSAERVGACQANSNDLPTILAGPILRHTAPDKLVVWLVTSSAQPMHLRCYQDDHCLAKTTFPIQHKGYIQLGSHAHLHLLQLTPESPFSQDEWLSYDIGIGETGQEQWLNDLMPQEFFYEDRTRPDFIIKSHVDHILHGSCRKPHHKDKDGLLSVDEALAAARRPNTSQTEQPALLMMSGDQIYADDVAGPMLCAIQQVITLLGLREEQIDCLDEQLCSSDLPNHQHNLYGRNNLLPDTDANQTLRETLFLGARKPIFTSVNSDNHLISLDEVLGMYLLVWSPELWKRVSMEPVNVPEEHTERYAVELSRITQFIKGLPRVRRALAHVPVYMIFDDHDVTDDWNLNKLWEESAYAEPFSKRIIGNALIGYLLCQGWGNAPDHFADDLMGQVQLALDDEQPTPQDDLIERLLHLRQWHYTIATTPKLVVLDTRTQRWVNQHSKNDPSGLLDETALDEMQADLLDEEAVILSHQLRFLESSSSK